MTRWTIKVGLPVEATLVTDPTHLLPQVVRKSASILEQFRLGNTSAEIWHCTFNISLLWVIRRKISKLVIKQKKAKETLTPSLTLPNISSSCVTKYRRKKHCKQYSWSVVVVSFEPTHFGRFEIRVLIGGFEFWRQKKRRVLIGGGGVTSKASSWIFAGRGVFEKKNHPRGSTVSWDWWRAKKTKIIK